MDEKMTFLIHVMEDNVPADVVVRSNVPNLVQDFFGVDFIDACSIISRVPDVFYETEEDFLNWLDQFREFYYPKADEVKLLFLKYPQMMRFKGDVLTFRLRMMSVVYDVTFGEALRLFYHFPNLVLFKKSDVVNQIKFISRELGCDSFVERKILRKDPRLLFVTSKVLGKAKDFFKTSLGLGEADVRRIFVLNPALAITPPSALKEYFDALSPSAFDKAQLRQIFLNCPDVFTLSPKELLRTVTAFSHDLDIPREKAIALLSRSAKLLMFDDYRLQDFLNFGISKSYLANYPKIMYEPEIGVFIKFMVARCLKIEKHFVEIVKIDALDLIARLMFLQSYKIVAKDVFLPEKEFEEKYQVSMAKIREDFRPSVDEISKLVEYYQENYAKGSHELFDVCQMYSFLNDEFTPPSTLDQNKSIYAAICNLGFSLYEAFFVLQSNPSMIFYEHNYVDDCRLLQKFVGSKEKVLSLVLANPSILSFSPIDLENLIDTLPAKNEEELRRAFIDRI